MDGSSIIPAVLCPPNNIAPNLPIAGGDGINQQRTLAEHTIPVSVAPRNLKSEPGNNLGKLPMKPPSKRHVPKVRVVIPTAVPIAAPKPPPPCAPPVWCQTRQELCESLPYFRSYQSGVYHRRGGVFGYLLDGFPSKYVNPPLLHWF